MPKRLIVTGASGFIGKQLVPRLVASGCELLLVGRSSDVLNKLFPDIPNCSYGDICERGKNFDTLVHLAVLNNNNAASQEEFERVNVKLLQETLTAAKGAGTRLFINLTTYHALSEQRSQYAQSKRAALELLQHENEISTVNVFLPAVYGDDFSGKFALVKKMPSFLKPAAITFLSALAPTVHVEKLVEFLIEDIDVNHKDVMLYNDQDNNTVYCFGKRLVDVLFAAVVVILAGWLLLIVWMLVKIGSPGPGIFAQKRVGKNGASFTCYKFRTMKTNTKQAGTHELTSDAITKTGAFLRKTKIDELPQVLNILRGELSLVGPRPGLPVQKELTQVREKFGVFKVLPGITGFAQIKGVDMSDPERLVRLDARYIAQRGLLLDLKIILSTFLGRGQGDRVGSRS